jgi:hypothetical protein
MLIALPLLFSLAGAPAPPNAPALAPPAAVFGEYDELLATYEQAFAAYRVGREAGERPKHPAIEFLPRFEALGAEEPRAYLWVLDHMREGKLSMSKRRDKAEALFAELLVPDGPEDVVVDACLALADHARNLETEVFRERCQALFDGAPSDEVRAAALFGLAQVISEGGRTKDEAAMEEAGALLERAIVEFKGTRAGGASADEAFRLLEREFSRAQGEFFRKAQAGDVSWDDDPTATFYERFEALAESGSGRALLWTLQNVQASGLAWDEQEAHAAVLREQLLANFSDHDMMVEFAQGLPFTAMMGDADGAIDTARGLLERTENPDVRAETLYALAAVLAERADSDEDIAEVKELLAALSKEFPGHRLIEQGEQLVFRLENLRIGRPAPDFEAEDGGFW